jgi:DNA modification methylase
VNRCFIGDCRDTMRDLIAQGVRAHLCVTSPPYDDLRVYGGHSWDFEGTAQALYDILVDGGVVCWNVGDQVVDGSESLTSFKQALYFKEQAGFRVHDTMIWEKPNFSSPETVRYHQVFEYVFVFSKGKPRVFTPIIDRANVYAGKTTFGIRTKRQADGTLKQQGNVEPTPPLGMRGNVWKGNTAGQEAPCQSDEFKHPAMMASWLARDLIYTWSNPGDIVIDPFAGSGTTSKEAASLGRQWINIDINPQYEPLQQKRTAQMGMAL